jgi:outer membrane protein assembly factor BamB
MRRRIVIGLAALLALALAGVGVAYVISTDKPDAGLDTVLEGISVETAAEDVETELETTPTTTEESPAKNEDPEEPPERCWTEFGGNPQRTSALPEVKLGPPARKPLWARGYRDTMEFPPTFCDGVLYANLQKTGRTLAVDAKTGETIWEVDGNFKASSPAIYGGLLLVSSHDGTVTAFRRRDGKRIWRFAGPGKIESSPVVVDDVAYFGTTTGRVFAVTAGTGAVRWAYNTGGRINASPSIWGDRVCISTYAGSVVCLRRSDGSELWTTYIRRDTFRYESFYASPSTDGQRVYTVARTGKVVALRASDGSVAWTQHMNSLGYGTPTIAHGRIFVGAYDGLFRSYRASDGMLLWSTRVPGRIAGPALVVGALVFFSTYDGRTYGARVGDGRIIWRFKAGAYAPGIATDRMYYMSMGGMLVAYPPRGWRRTDASG